MIGEEFELEAIRAVIAAEGDPDPERRMCVRAELMATIGPEVSTPNGVSPKEPKPRRLLAVRPWGIGAVSGVAAGVAAVVLVLGHGGAVQPASAVAAILDRAANAPSLVSPEHLGPGQVWYSEQVRDTEITQTPNTCTSNCYETRVVRWWVGPHTYSMRMYVIGHSAKRQTVTKAPPNVPLTNPACCGTRRAVGNGYDGLLSYREMLTISTSVSSLRSLMWHMPSVQSTGPKPRWEVDQMILDSIQSILSAPRVPARMLSGLYRLLATMPGATLTGSVTDTLGRHAVEVEYRVPLAPSLRGADMRVALLFDPKSYVLLDTIATWKATDKFPSSYSDTAYVSSGLVHRIGGLPAGPTNH